MSLAPSISERSRRNRSQLALMGARYEIPYGELRLRDLTILQGRAGSGNLQYPNTSDASLFSNHLHVPHFFSSASETSMQSAFISSPVSTEVPSASFDTHSLRLRSRLWHLRRPRRHQGTDARLSPPPRNRAARRPTPDLYSQEQAARCIERNHPIGEALSRRQQG